MSTVFHMPEGLAELRARLERDWHRRSEAIWRSGVPVADRHVLLKSVEKIDGDLKSLREEHADKFRAQREAEKAVADATDRGESITPDSDLFKALDEAGKATGEIEDRIHAQETVKARLVQQMAAAGIEPSGEGSAVRDDYIAELRAMRADLGGLGKPTPSAGERLTSTEHYAELQRSGAFTRSEYGGRIALGEALNRDELRAALITGGDPGSAGAFVQPQRIGYYPLPLRPLTVLDLITIGQTDSDLIEYVRMLAFTNAAAETPEAISAATIGDGTGGTVTAVQGGQKPESAMTFEIVQEAVSTIAHWVPATKRSLADAGQMRTIIDGMLRWGLGDRLERQVVNGDGVGDNLLGLLQQTGTNAISGVGSMADKIHRGITQNRLDSFASTGIILNPLDAETIWLSRENADGSGAYLFGGPANPGPRTLWGLPVAETPAMPQGTAIVGALQAAILWLREGTQVLASDSHRDFFTRNLVAVLAEMRAGFGVPTPGAFAEVNLTA